MSKRLSIIQITMLSVALALVCMFGVAYVSYGQGQQSVQQTQTVDITVMPCSAWDNGADPTIPPNTFTGACVKDDGTLVGR